MSHDEVIDFVYFNFFSPAQQACQELVFHHLRKTILLSQAFFIPPLTVPLLNHPLKSFSVFFLLLFLRYAIMLSPYFLEYYP